MKKIKLFPIPHVEVRLHLSDQMIKDYKECQKMAEEDLDGKDCDKCSWRDIAWLNCGFCELKELRNLIEDEKYTSCGIVNICRDIAEEMKAYKED